jgi:hypothetical protein
VLLVGQLRVPVHRGPAGTAGRPGVAAISCAWGAHGQPRSQPRFKSARTCGQHTASRNSTRALAGAFHAGVVVPRRRLRSTTVTVAIFMTACQCAVLCYSAAPWGLSLPEARSRGHALEIQCGLRSASQPDTDQGADAQARKGFPRQRGPPTLAQGSRHPTPIAAAATCAARQAYCGRALRTVAECACA